MNNKIGKKILIDKFTDVMILNASKTDNFFYKYLKSASNICNILQKLFKNTDNEFIENAYSKQKVMKNDILNVVNLKGGIMADYLANNNINEIKASDLDFSVYLTNTNDLIIDMIELCATEIKIELNWIQTIFNNFITNYIGNEIIFDNIFEGADKLLVYNSYQNFNYGTFNKETTQISKIIDCDLKMCHSLTKLTHVLIIRFYYKVLMRDINNKILNLKINIVDLSINISKKLISLPLLQNTKIFDFYIKTNIKSSMLTDQLSVLVLSAIRNDRKLEKRINRVNNLIDSILNDSNVYLDKIYLFNSKEVNHIIIVQIFGDINNIVSSIINHQNVTYPFLLVPIILWININRNFKYIFYDKFEFSPQQNEFTKICNGKHELLKLLELRDETEKSLLRLNPILQKFYLIKTPKKALNKFMSGNGEITNDQDIIMLFKTISSDKLGELYKNLNEGSLHYNEYYTSINYWNVVKKGVIDIEDFHLIIYNHLTQV